MKRNGPDPLYSNGSGPFALLLGLLLLGLLCLIGGELILMFVRSVIAAACYVGGGCAGGR